MFFITFATYPEGIFGKYLRMVFYTLLPVGFMVFMPVNIIKDFSLLKTIAVFAAAFVYLSLAYIIFYNGLKRYESGNLMEGKI
jgi:ABC-2 type transport system permease protein